MVVLLFFAFLAGIFTILSPCILPILPALLSGATTKGRSRPAGIILGLMASFAFFTLALTGIVNATGISANVLRYAAIGLVFFFGLVMIFPGLSDWFARLTTPLANVGQKLQGTKPKSGFWGGILFGMALGLLWTPCAGPILAAITTLVATQGVNFSTVLITIAYSLGAGIPMFLIAYGGNKVIESSQFLRSHAERIRQGFGVLMVLTAVAIAMHWDAKIQQNIISYVPPIYIEDNPFVKSKLDELRGVSASSTSGELQELGPAPEFVGIARWINSEPLKMSELKGKVVLIDFWTYSCINCLRTLPYITKWYADYKDKGLVIIGVHTPEFEFEKDYNNVLEATKRLGVKYPVPLDNNYKTWTAYHNNYWPAHYLIDQKGNIRMVHFGEGAYGETENAIRELLGMEKLRMVEEKLAHRFITPETYLGSERGSDNYISGITLKLNDNAYYTFNTPLKADTVGIKGHWKVEGERITATGADSELSLSFLATNVYLVLSGTSKSPLEISLDGKNVDSIIVDGDRKYDIVTVPYERHLLQLHVPEGVSAYAFTFGDER